MTADGFICTKMYLPPSSALDSGGGAYSPNSLAGFGGLFRGKQTRRGCHAGREMKGRKEGREGKDESGKEARGWGENTL